MFRSLTRHRLYRRLVVALVAVGLLPALIAANSPATAQDQAAAAKPNVIFLLLDDLERVDFSKFPNINRELVRGGANLSNNFVTDSLCCPSRATILRSQYVHNHGVLHNKLPEGGFSAFQSKGNERSNLATWLKAAGYRTGLVGKYFNGYRDAQHVPAGWDNWVVPFSAGFYKGFNYDLSENGQARHYGDAPNDYITDVFSRKATTFISTSGNKPFFLYLSTAAPHTPATPAPRHANAFPGASAPRTPSWDQADMSSYPSWLRDKNSLRPLQIEKIDTLYRKRMQSMLAVDDMVGNIMKTLRAQGKADNTYFVFTSDNGHHLGQHRLGPGKKTVFEEDIHVPAYVAGPGIRAGSRVDALTANVDWAPTITQWAGATLPAFADGRSLVPLLGGQSPQWRNYLLIDHHKPDVVSAAAEDPDDNDQLFEIETAEGNRMPFKPDPPTYFAVRSKTAVYTEYSNGDREFYDLVKDPHQLRNTANANPAQMRTLANELRGLRGCKAAACRQNEQ